VPVEQKERVMRIGASLFLIAVGAILKWAITKHFSGINLHVVGVILLVIGIIGLAVDLYLWTTRRNSTVLTHSNGVTYVDSSDLADRP
jgi:Domain of unknown function (DUF6458)